MNEIVRSFAAVAHIKGQHLACRTRYSIGRIQEQPITTAATIRQRPGSRASRRGRKDDRLARIIVFSVAGIIIALSTIAGTIARGRSEPSIDLTEQAEALRSGAILIVAPNGLPCHRKSIDNDTWLIRDGGPVDCDTAVSEIMSSQRQKWSTKRVEAIRAGLSGR